MMRTIVLWSAYMGPPILGKYQTAYGKGADMDPTKVLMRTSRWGGRGLGMLGRTKQNGAPKPRSLVSSRHLQKLGCC